MYHSALHHDKRRFREICISDGMPVVFHPFLWVLYTCMMLPENYKSPVWFIHHLRTHWLNHSQSIYRMLPLVKTSLNTYLFAKINAVPSPKCLCVLKTYFFWLPLEQIPSFCGICSTFCLAAILLDCPQCES